MTMGITVTDHRCARAVAVLVAVAVAVAVVAVAVPVVAMAVAFAVAVGTWFHRTWGKNDVWKPYLLINGDSTG